MKVRIMNRKGDQEQILDKSQLVDLMCKLGKNQYFITRLNQIGDSEVVRDVNQLSDSDTITLMPVISGGSI